MLAALVPQSGTKSTGYRTMDDEACLSAGGTRTTRVVMSHLDYIVAASPLGGVAE